ncbi:MAG: hypothetical protein NWR43_03160, partial [Alphaproteobacteria bacterium]|nr:hypothetical protein [Alphaproteobacteria bacterium]
ISQLQLDAITSANAINNNTRNAVVWAIENAGGAWAGVAAGTIPAGIVQSQGAPVNHPGDVLFRVVWLNTPNVVIGNIVAGPIPNIVIGNDITVHTGNLRDANIAGGTYVVFDSINQDAVDNAKKDLGNMAIKP